MTENKHNKLIKFKEVLCAILVVTFFIGGFFSFFSLVSIGPNHTKLESRSTYIEACMNANFTKEQCLFKHLDRVYPHN